MFLAASILGQKQMKEEALIRTCLAISCPLFNSLKNPVKEVALAPLCDEKFESYKQ